MHEAPAQHYRLRLAAIAAQQHLLRRRARALFIAFATLAVLTGALAWQACSGALPIYPASLFFIAAAALVPRLLGLRFNQTYRLHRLTEHLDIAVDRATGQATQSGLTGEEFRVPNHLYGRDLDILGTTAAPTSLFGLLCTVRTHLAQRRLAQSLLRQPTPDQIVARQRAIVELAPLTDLRERIALLGSTPIQQIPADLFDAWLDEPAISAHPATRKVLAFTATLIGGLIALGLTHRVSWPTLEPNLAALLAIQSAIALFLRPRILSPMERASRLAAPAALLRQALGLLAAESFSSPTLTALQPTPAALKSLRELQTQLTFLEQRTKEWFYLPCLLFSVGTRATLALEAWKRNHAPDLRRWLDAWAEFEVLNALASFAFEHPAYVYPEILPAGSPATFNATRLAHPLLPAAAVVNDIAFGGADDDRQTDHLYLISGSNMAGKSTLLRAIGVNAVLAGIGAPIRAASASVSPLAIGASLALTDSLADGRSKFLAEVERLVHILALARSGQPTLFLIDEIFSGTNSLDRRAAAEAILRQLAAHGAIGALSTHDLSLTSLADQPALKALNLHMASSDPDDPLAFDYRLKPGINTSSNARAILRMMHLDPELFKSSK